MEATLTATRAWPRLVLQPNGDPGREGIAAALEAEGVATVGHLPRPLFLRLLKSAAAIVGNSSAALIEAAALRPGGVPQVRHGARARRAGGTRRRRPAVGVPDAPRRGGRRARRLSEVRHGARASPPVRRG